MSRFDTAVQTRRRIVLYGNVLDWVHNDAERLSFIEWLRRRLSHHNIDHVVLYNFCEEPRVLSWGELDRQEAQNSLIEAITRTSNASGPRNQAPDPTNPTLALRGLTRLLHE